MSSSSLTPQGPSPAASALTPVYFGFSATPFFYNLVFPDNAPLEEAWRHLLLSRQKSSEAALPAYSALQQQTGARSVGDLRRLSDAEWRSLDIPAVAKVYLKYLARQSQRPSGSLSHSALSIAPLSISTTPNDTNSSPSARIIQLQNEFNRGQPFDMTSFQPLFEPITSMGFSRDDALEALLVLENKSVENAIEYLLLPTETRRSRREEAAARMNQRKSTRSPSIPTGSSPSSAAASAAFQNELNQLKTQLANERLNRARAENEAKRFLESKDREGYKEYLRGLLGGESINVQAYEQLRREREQRKISSAEHNTILQELGISVDKFEAMKQFDKGSEKECVVCLEFPKDHVLFPCGHLCLCEQCAEKYRITKNYACPLCSKKVSQISKVYL